MPCALAATICAAFRFAQLQSAGFGPRAIATTGGILYGLGVFLAGFVPHDSLYLLYLTYGIIVGIGIGLGYIVPIAMLIKWFPDRRGLITGLAVAGLGFGSLIVAPIVTATMAKDGIGLSSTFMILGIAYLIVVVGAAQFFRKAPDGYAPPGWVPSTQQNAIAARRNFTGGPSHCYGGGQIGSRQCRRSLLPHRSLHHRRGYGG